MWEWCDHAVYKGTARDGRSVYYYGGDHGEDLHDGNFCVDGLVYPDRTPHTSLLEYKNVHRPARVVSFACGNSVKEILGAPGGTEGAGSAGENAPSPAAEAGAACILTLKNEMNFTDLRDYISLEYELACDEMRVAAGMISSTQLPSILPGKTGKVFLTFPELPETGEVYLRIMYLLRRADTFREEEMLLGFDEIPLPDGAGKRKNRVVSSFAAKADDDARGKSPARAGETDRSLILYGENFIYSYSKLTGTFECLCYEGRDLLDRAMTINLWRAPVDNDRHIRIEWEKAGYDRAVSRAYSTEYEASGSSMVIRSRLSMAAPGVQKMMDIDAVWTVSAGGQVSVRMDVRRNPEFPELPRFGIRLFLPEDMQNAVYYGLGPLESYADKRRASYHALFAANVRDLHEDYIRPQENGSHCGCKYVTLCDNDYALTAYSSEPFSFNASAYTQEELTAKAHNYELETCGSTVLCLDARQDGIGSNSCGPRPRAEYRFNEETFTFSLNLLPSPAEP